MTEQRIDDAKRYFSDLRGEPNYRSEAFYYLGRLAETERDFFQATRSYARVTDGTHAVEAQLRTARILYAEQNDREGAVRHLRDFGAANPRFATDMLVAQAQLLLQMEQPEEAMRVLDEALAATPDDPALHAAHAQLYVIRVAKRRRARRARRSRDAAQRRPRAATPTTRSLRYSLALLYEDQDRNRKALDVLEALAEDNPDDAAILNAYGYLLTDQFDRHDEARDYIERALALNPDSPAIIDSMGWVLYKLGDYGAARDYLERAYRLEQDPEIAAHLVDVRWQLGERDSALELLRQSLEANPDSRHLKRSTSGSRHELARRRWRSAGRGRARAACATLPAGSDGLEPRRSGAQRSNPSARGRCAAASPSTPASGGFQGSFNWRQQDDALELTVRGPLAQRRAASRGARRDALTVTARGETRTLTDPEAELSELARLVAAGREPAALAARLSRQRLSRRHGARRRWHARVARATALARRLSGVRTRGDGRRDGQRSARAAPHRLDARRAHAASSRSTIGNRRATAVAP